MTPHGALRAVTLDAAYSLWLKNQVGNIVRGKLANLTILAASPLQVDPVKIKDIAVWRTVQEGRVLPIHRVTGNRVFPVLDRLLAGRWLSFHVAAPRLSSAITWGRSGTLTGQLGCRETAPRGLTRIIEETFEPLGLSALTIQVVTGVWMGWIVLPGFRGLFSPANPIGTLVGVKLLLAATIRLGGVI